MIDVNMVGMKELKKDFAEMRKRIGEPKVLMDSLGGMGAKNVIQHFDAEEGPLGSWAPLKHPRKRGGSGILKDTGRLRAATRFRTVGRTEAHVFNGVKYAAAHNFGATIKKGSMSRMGGHGYITYDIPRRKFMWIDERMRGTMRKSMIRWILKGLAN
ncbi:MAG: phage virion morphogenesis protein [Dehalococcoidia bacterium]|jgi:phage gpG-like protein